MKDNFWQSKKFWAAVIGAITALGTFLTTHFGMDLPVDEAVNLVYAIAALFGVYMAAEGYSEKDAKAIRENPKASEVPPPNYTSISSPVGGSVPTWENKK